MGLLRRESISTESWCFLLLRKVQENEGDFKKDKNAM